MIQYNNVPNKLPRNFVTYKTVISAVSVIILAVILYLFLGNGPTNALVNGKPTVVDIEGALKFLIIFGIPLFLFILMYLYNILYYKTFSFSLTEDFISITSGIIYVSTKTIDFKDVQNISSRRGPMLMIFGLSMLNGFTASPGQLVVTTSSYGRSTSYKPDISIVLNQNDSEELRKFITKEETNDIQKVEVVSQQ